MTTIAPPATCAARSPLAHDVTCDRHRHTSRLHTADRDGVMLAWSDPDEAGLQEWEIAPFAAGEPDREAREVALFDAVEVLVAYWKSLPGGPKGTERFDPRIRAVIAAYDALGGAS